MRERGKLLNISLWKLQGCFLVATTHASQCQGDYQQNKKEEELFEKDSHRTTGSGLWARNILDGSVFFFVRLPGRNVDKSGFPSTGLSACYAAGTAQTQTTTTTVSSDDLPKDGISVL